MAHISGTLVWGQLLPLAPEKAGISCGKGVGEQSYFFIVGGKEKREGRREGEEESNRGREEGRGEEDKPSRGTLSPPKPFLPPRQASASKVLTPSQYPIQL